MSSVDIEHQPIQPDPEGHVRPGQRAPRLAELHRPGRGLEHRQELDAVRRCQQHLRPGSADHQLRRSPALRTATATRIRRSTTRSAATCSSASRASTDRSDTNRRNTTQRRAFGLAVFFALRKGGRRASGGQRRRHARSARGGRLPPERGRSHYCGASLPESPNAFMPALSAVISARSGGVRCGCQMSNIRMTRSLSLSLRASCSMVSSKTQASPGTHCRISLPTRNEQFSGMISAEVGDERARWTRRRALE